jgi:hypothetical protein
VVKLAEAIASFAASAGEDAQLQWSHQATRRGTANSIPACFAFDFLTFFALLP